MWYWIAFIVTEIARHWYLIQKRKIRPNYLGSFIWRAFWGLVCLIKAYPYVDPISRDIIQYWPLFIFEITSFWILFDIGLNLSRKKSIFYNGENSGWLDSIDEVLSKGVYWVLKGLALAVMIYMIIYLS